MRTIPNKLRVYIGTLLALALIVGLAMPMQTALAVPAPTIVYDAIPNPLAPNYPSLGFQATQTAEFGDYVHLAGTNRALRTVTVTMSDWALYVDYSTDIRYQSDSVNWTHPITVNIYSNHLSVNGVPDTLLGSVTQVSTIPWRPVADPTCTTPTAWRAGDGLCYNGFAFNLTFDMSSLNVTLPDDIIVSVAYNTQTWGAAPLGVAGPYSSLNVAVLGAATVGTDDNVDNVFWNTSTAGNYADAGAAGVGVFREDTGWTPNGTVNIQITAAAIPSDVYINSTWGSVLPGTDPDGSGPASQMGYDAFTVIQDGIAAAASGGTVHVAAGTYNEDVNLNKSLTLLGAGASSTTISGPIGGASASTITVASSNVTIDGFTITRAGNNTTDWNNPGLNTPGIAVQGTTYTGLSVQNNTITGNRTGIDINNSSGHTINNNIITNNRTGMILRNQTDNLTVTHNVITDNWTAGILFLDASGGTNIPVQTALSSNFSNNNISGNWYGQVVERQAGGSLPVPGTTNLKNFINNWWGTITPVVSTANSTEPGYTAQIPVAFGGTAVAPGGQPDILGPASANITYSPRCSDVTCTTFVPPFPLTVTANNHAISAGSVDPAFTFVYSGFVNGENETALTTAPTCTVPGAHTAPGTYSIICSGGVDANYSFNYVPGTLTVSLVSGPIEAYIGGVLRGSYFLAAGESTRQNYVGVDSGPVKVVHTGGAPIVSAIREAWAVNGVTTSFFQMMGLPQQQLSNKYVFPGYNNVTLNEQLRISNVDSVLSSVTVTIGGVLRGTYPLAAGEAVRINYPGLDSGPVVVQGTVGVKIISSIREAWAVNGVTTSFVQFMGLPAEQLSNKYVFPAYNNVTLNEQLRIGNVDTVASTVIVTIGGVPQGSPITLQPNEAVRINYPGLDSGPVIVEGTVGVKIISSIRSAWAVNGVTTSFSQLMGLPAGALSDTYMFPAYNNVTLNEQLRIANVDTVPSTVTVTIGGVPQGSPITLQPNEAMRINYPGLDSGPVIVQGTTGVKIISAIRDAWAVNGVTQSFVQLMGLPSGQLSSTFWFPAYNNVTLNEQLRIAVP